MAVRSKKTFDPQNSILLQPLNEEMQEWLKATLAHYPSIYEIDSGGYLKRPSLDQPHIQKAYLKLIDEMDQVGGMVHTVAKKFQEHPEIFRHPGFQDFSFPKKLENAFYTLLRIHLVELFLHANELFDYDLLVAQMGQLLNALNDKNVFGRKNVWLEMRNPNELDNILIFLRDQGFFEKASQNKDYYVARFNGVYPELRDKNQQEFRQNLIDIQRKESVYRNDLLRSFSRQRQLLGYSISQISLDLERIGQEIPLKTIQPLSISEKLELLENLAAFEQKMKSRLDQLFEKASNNFKTVQPKVNKTKTSRGTLARQKARGFYLPLPSPSVTASSPTETPTETEEKGVDSSSTS